MKPDPKSPRPTYPTERLAALSDGVFAMGLTLLVLDLKVPESPRGVLQVPLDDLEAQLPNFIAWVISFLLVARFWVVHHAIVASLARCHAGTMWWNFVVLGLMSLVPFAASLIGTYEFDPVAVLIFATLIGSAGLSIGLFARHAANETHLHRERAEVGALDWFWKYHSRVLPGVAAVSILIVGTSELAALVIWGVEPVFAVAGTFWRGKRRRPGGTGSSPAESSAEPSGR
ncbi:MAG: DUF1211 domain-containing protein [Planctomycetes bacterium]|nr:DUF1211 domain-containing protein [Planctomycetota bacterium]